MEWVVLLSRSKISPESSGNLQPCQHQVASLQRWSPVNLEDNYWQDTYCNEGVKLWLNSINMTSGIVTCTISSWDPFFTTGGVCWKYKCLSQHTGTQPFRKQMLLIQCTTVSTHIINNPLADLHFLEETCHGCTYFHLFCCILYGFIRWSMSVWVLIIRCDKMVSHVLPPHAQ